MWPVWLLDIDGVVNASARPAPVHVWPEDHWIETSAQGSTRVWPIVAARPVINFINYVHYFKFAEVVWLTTWQGRANNVSDALGLPHLRILENATYRQNQYAGQNWWKLTEFATMYLEGRPTIWTDDDISEHIRDLVNNIEIKQGASETLLITPSNREGLGPWHLKKIAEFCGFWYEEAITWSTE